MTQHYKKAKNFNEFILKINLKCRQMKNSALNQNKICKEDKIVQ